MERVVENGVKLEAVQEKAGESQNMVIKDVGVISH